MTIRFARIGAFAVLALAAISAQATSYTFSTLSRPGATTTSIWDVNNLGQIAGYSNTDGEIGARSFVYQGGTYTALTGPAGAVSTNALGISDTGIVVGNYSSGYTKDADGNIVFAPDRGFVYKAGIYTSFDIAGATNTYLRAVSSDGRYMTGYYTNDTTAGQGFVVDTLTSSVTFVSTGGLDSFAIAQGVSNAGVVMGSDVLSGPPSSRPGFIYDLDTGTRTDVNLPGANRTALRAIDESGVISGWFRDTSFVTHGFTGYPGAFQVIDFPSTDYTAVEGSNDAGVLVGFYGSDLSGAFVATPVPEPETWALMLAGLALLPWARRRV